MKAKILWFTGLSGAGKTTISKILKKELLKRKKIVKILDGDIFRKKNKNPNSFNKKNILKNNYSIIKYINTIVQKYEFIIVSAISPLLITRKFAKKIFKENYIEIFVYCKIKTLEKRDTKNLYKKAKLKLINNLIGYNSKIKYQKSNYSVIKINTDRLSKKESNRFLINKLKKII